MATANGGMYEIFKAQILLNQKENMVTGLIMLMVLEFATGIFKEIFNWLRKYADEYLKKKFQRRIQEAVTSKLSAKIAELFFERNYTLQNNWDKADAILHKVLKIPASQTALVVGQLEIVKNHQEFSIDENVKFQLLDLKVDDKGSLEHINFRLFSETFTICQLRHYVEDQVEVFLVMKKNNLGNKTFYFDHIVEKRGPRASPSQKVLFSKHLFQTNRTLDNVFHERQEEVKHRVKFFLERKDWYDKRGIPHTLGLLFHGSPGTGKTSSVKAIANMSERHIININLSSINTKKQLKKLFYDERLEVCENMGNTNNVTEYIIPIDKRVYVIEDIDAIDSDIVLRRTAQKNDTITYIEQEPMPIRSGGMQFTNELNAEDTSDLDLSTILNIIDGTLETPGRILIISSNYPEKLDEALIRPGRIDMLIEFKKCNHTVLRDMFYSFFETEPDPESIKQISEYSWTPAEVGQLLFKNFGHPDNALKELVETDPREYFKFSHFNSAEPTPEEPDANVVTSLLVEPEPVVEPEPAVEPEPEPTVEPEPEPEPSPALTAPAPARPPSQPEPQEPEPEPQEELMQRLDGERNASFMDVLSTTDLQTLMGGTSLSEALQTNTHQGTHTLLNTYKSSDSGYAYAGLS